jgi:hypothetical protein
MIKEFFNLAWIFWFVSLTSVLSAQETHTLKPEMPELAPVAPDSLPTTPEIPMELSNEELAKLMKFYQQIDPDIKIKMNRLQESEPIRYQMEIERLYREQEYLARLEKEVPERYKAAIEMRRLSAGTEKMAELYKKTAQESERSKIETDLRNTLSQLFDLKEKEKKLEIERIRDRLEKLEQEMNERHKNREIIIKNRLNELTGKGSVYEW